MSSHRYPTASETLSLKWIPRVGKICQVKSDPAPKPPILDYPIRWPEPSSSVASGSLAVVFIPKYRKKTLYGAVARAYRVHRPVLGDHPFEHAPTSPERPTLRVTSTRSKT